MEDNQLLIMAMGSIITGVVSGWASAQITIAKLSVHVDVLRETARAHEEELRRLNRRIDNDACNYPVQQREQRAG